MERYLADEPVEACPPSAWYRLRKFARRNKAALATAGLVAAALVAGTAVSVWQAVSATDARRQAEADRDRAEAAQRQAEAAEGRSATDASIARAVNDFLQVDVIGQAKSSAPLARDIEGDPHLTVREALDRASARIGQRFQNQPLVEAAIRTAIGESYSSLSEYSLAAPTWNGQSSYAGPIWVTVTRIPSAAS